MLDDPGERPYFRDASYPDYASGPIAIPLGPRTQTAGFVRDFFRLIRSPHSLTVAGHLDLELTSAMPFAAMGLLFSSTVQTMSVEVDSSAPAMIFPQFAAGGGWGMQIQLGNSSNASITGRINFYEYLNVISEGLAEVQHLRAAQTAGFGDAMESTKTKTRARKNQTLSIKI